MSIRKKFMIVFFVTCCMLMIMNCNTVFAKNVTLNNLESDASDFISKGSKKAGDLSEVTDSITGNFKGLGKILTGVGAGILVAVIAYMGIQYLVSPPDKRAALKQKLIGVTAAGVVIFGAYGIWAALVRVFSNFD